MNILYKQIKLDYKYETNIVHKSVKSDYIIKQNLAVANINDPIILSLVIDEPFTIVTNTVDALNTELKSDDFAFTIDSGGHDMIEGIITADNNLPAKGTAYLYYDKTFIKSVVSDNAGNFSFDNINGNLLYNIEVKLDDAQYDGKVVYNIAPAILPKIPILTVLSIVAPWPQLYRTSQMKYVIELSNYEGTIELSMVPSYGWIIEKTNNIFTLSGTPNIPDNESIFKFVIKVSNTILDGTVNIYDYTYSHSIIK